MPSPHPSADRSALRLSDAARHVVIPEGIVDSLWFDVVERCAEWGDVFDPWQDGLGQAILGIRDDGMFAATVGGVTLSIPRQVVKTFIIGRICMALCSLFPNLTILWTAHRTRTTTNTFQRLKSLAFRPAVRGYITAGSNNGTAIRDANGEQEIPFANGSRILFGAREGGFGRGFDEIDVEVFDEAQILTIKALEDMVAATNQSRFRHGALLFYMGTPPRPVDPGEVFTERRAEALRAKRAANGADFGPVVESGDALFVECSADANVGHPGGPSLDDPRQVEKANPSYPLRTPPVSIKRLRKNLPSDEAWRREGLGVWDSATANILVDAKTWDSCRTITPPTSGGVVSYGVKFSLDGSRVALAAARRPDVGPVHVEVVGVAPTNPGIDDLVPWLVQRWDAAGSVVIDGKSGSGDLVNELLEAGVNQRRLVSNVATRRGTTLTVDDVTAAHAGWLRDVTTGGLTHFDQRGLNAAVRCAGKRKIGQAGGWGLEPVVAGGDVTALEAVILARYGATMAKRRVRTGEASFV